jgi:hypothetical protein
MELYISLYKVKVTLNVEIRIFKNVILLVVLWSRTSMEECRLRVFKHRVQRRIFGPKKDEVTGGRRNLCNVMNSFITCTLRRVHLERYGQGG